MARRKFNSIAELENEIKQVTSVALGLTIEELTKKLHDIIEKDVYDRYYGEWASSGLRTMEFLESWVHENATDMVSGNTIDAQRIIQDINMLHQYNWTRYLGFPPIHVQKGSLAQIIEEGDGRNNEGEKTNGYLIGDAPPRPFWEDFISWAEKQAPKIFQRNCRALGMDIKLQ